jgi:acetylornithine deacetylase/succinyl-diaminopimelate desuccinylase-like protein
MKRLLLVALLLLPLAACRTVAPPVDVTLAPRIEEMRQLMNREDVVASFERVDRDRERIVTEWRELVEIPAPSGAEGKRADRVEALLRQTGLQPRRDEAGNVIATRKGTGGGAHVVFDAHLDTVFPAGTDVKTRVEGGRIFAPGAGDDTRNVESLLAMIRAMNAADVKTNGDVTFVFTVEEETTFRGVEKFLADNAKSIDRYVTLDGGYGGFTYGGIGTYWYRYHFLGPGGHTRSATPPYSATVPVARTIDRIMRIRLPEETNLNVGMLGAGDVFNAKASDAWFSLDLRSNDQATLTRLDKAVERIAKEEAEKAHMKMRRDVTSREDVASLPGHRNSETVLTTEAVFHAFGFEPVITNTASNHTSAALRAGIEAVGTGTAPCERSHSLEENCEIDPIFTGIKRNIMLAVALSRVK